MRKRFQTVATQFEDFCFPVLGLVSNICVAPQVSLGWGVAAYSQALRLVRADKGRLSWAGLVLQTAWRVSMLTARVAALVLLCLALGSWATIVLGRCHLALQSPAAAQRLSVN